ncbi:MAG: YifB family Mg chelatase-like AAA ATPase, partial [Candidatus Sumerlaeota bacterium]
DESLETTKIHSVAGQLGDHQALMATRPFRAPHHTISSAALIGGGSIPRPGEVSLAHNGVLFLDEFAELPRATLEALRQPLEDGIVTISRSAMTLTFPARFLMCAAMNPCPCGFHLDTERQCVCSHAQILKYRSRLSGPMMDRIDLHVEVPPVKFEALRGHGADEEPSKSIRQRTQAARERQSRRFKEDSTGRFCNAHMGKRHLKEFCSLDTRSEDILESSMRRLGLSARAYDRILKVSRTIADLDNSDRIEPQHLKEAIQYRDLDRDKDKQR